MFDLIVLGGGAAGIFASLAAIEACPTAKVAVLEKTAVLLAKVRISGGGRCNVTHACFDPIALSKNYPRGNKELVGPFHRFQPLNTIEWFESKGVKLKTEADGRMFPITDRSETIIDALLEQAKKAGIEIYLKERIESVSKRASGFTIISKEGKTFSCKKLLLATGSSADGYLIAQQCGHSLQNPVPSLFTFNVPTSPLKELSGISFEKVRIEIKDTPFSQTGPFLITHFGFSGPAAIKLSAWAARFLFEKNYHAELVVNWLPELTAEEIFKKLTDLKLSSGQKKLFNENLFRLPKSFWHLFLDLLGESFKKKILDISLKDLRALANKLHADSYHIEGKTTHKEEFVTCGGVHLKEVNFKTLESKITPGLFFAGEILDIDGITGGFNFQSAWTTGYIAGTSSTI